MADMVQISRETLEKVMVRLDDMYLHYITKADKSRKPMKALEHRGKAHEILSLMSDIEDFLDPKE